MHSEVISAVAENHGTSHQVPLSPLPPIKPDRLVHTSSPFAVFLAELYFHITHGEPHFLNQSA